jgi:uncharacterized protein YkwD
MLTANLTVDESKIQEYQPTGEHEIVYELINEARSEKGFKKLEYDRKLEMFAWAYADDMINRDFFGHYNPDGENIGDRLDRARVSFSIVGEILAESPSAEKAVQAWLNSQTHYDTIMRSEYEDMGVGISFGEGHKYYVVIFYKPLEYPNLGRTVFLGESR